MQSTHSAYAKNVRLFGGQTAQRDIENLGQHLGIIQVGFGVCAQGPEGATHQVRGLLVYQQIPNDSQIVEQIKFGIALKDYIPEAVNCVHAGFLNLPPIGIVSRLFCLGHVEVPA